ncbi:hypothetical protein O6461_24550, partial [Salmonella enterica subsp. enterica]
FHTVKSVKLTTDEIDLAVNAKEEVTAPTETSESDEETEKTAEATNSQSDIKLEITNPDDIQTDNGGQIELF